MLLVYVSSLSVYKMGNCCIYHVYVCICDIFPVTRYRCSVYRRRLQNCPCDRHMINYETCASFAFSPSFWIFAGIFSPILIKNDDESIYDQSHGLCCFYLGCCYERKFIAAFIIATPECFWFFFFLNMKFLHILKDTHHENWYSYMPRWKWNSLVFLFLDWIYDNTEPIVGVLSQYVIYMLIHEIWVKSGIWGQRWWWWGLIFWLTLPILVDRSRRVKFRIYRNTGSSLI